MQDPLRWWQGCSIYQIYPRSYKDTTGDGVGDLQGIIEKLDYIKSLGVDAIWVCPFYESPMVDFGYDVSDYRKVDPVFGTNQHLKELVSKAHKLGLKVIVDLVMSHTSEKHRWFEESVRDPNGPYGDYYVWVEGKEGTLPNNWLSVFGGPAWSWSPERGAYYFHNFLKQQPDLNLYNEKVKEELFEIVKFWIGFGVDGFRLDACNCYFHDTSLLDNPVSPKQNSKVQDEANPYFQLVHIYDKSQPANVEFLKELRSLVDNYDDKFLIGEIFCDREEETTRLYSANSEPLHSAYNFSLLQNDREVDTIRNAVTKYHTISKSTAWSLSNHDVERVVSRWHDSLSLQNRAKGYLTILAGMPGIIIVYQGEELGLPEAILRGKESLDPFGNNIDSPYPGRDGCRTPMPWTEDLKGFTDGEPWLPVPQEHMDNCVSLQESDESSSLNHFKALMKFRNDTEVFKEGSIQFWQDDLELIAFSRFTEKEAFLVLSSFTNRKLEMKNVHAESIVAEVSFGIHLDNENGEERIALEAGAFGVIKLRS